MTIETTTIQAVSPTESQVHMVLGDVDQGEKATFHLDFDAMVSHAENPLVAEIQAAALRQLRDEVSSEIERLSTLASQRA
jgi:hypothetical protein